MSENENEKIRVPRAEIGVDPDYIRQDEDLQEQEELFQEQEEDIEDHPLPFDLKSQKLIWILGGVGIALLIVIIVILSGSNDKASRQELKLLFSRFEKLEARLTRLEGMEARVTLLEKQDNELEQFLKELDKTERAVEKRLVKLTKDFDSLEERRAVVPKKTAVSRVTRRSPVKTEVAPPVQEKPVTPVIAPAERKFYEVRPGDTLYRIALKNGISVGELCRLNNMTPTTVIQPGQKLLVSQGTGE
jgi:LysM repeat protein